MSLSILAASTMHLESFLRFWVSVEVGLMNLNFSYLDALGRLNPSVSSGISWVTPTLITSRMTTCFKYEKVLRPCSSAQTCTCVRTQSSCSKNHTGKSDDSTLPRSRKHKPETEMYILNRYDLILLHVYIQKEKPAEAQNTQSNDVVVRKKRSTKCQSNVKKLRKNLPFILSEF